MPAITTTQWATQLAELLEDQGLELDSASAFATAFAGQVTDWLGGDNAIPAQLAQSLSGVLTNWNTFTARMVDFLTVPAEGGPHDNGTIDVVDYLGVTHTIAGLAKLAEDLALAEEALEGVEVLLGAVADAIAAESSAAGSASAAAASAAATLGYRNTAEGHKNAAASSAGAASASAGVAGGHATAASNSADASEASNISSAGHSAASATARDEAEAARDMAEFYKNQAAEIAGFDPTNYQLKSAKGTANGYAGLDADGDVPAAHFGKVTKAHVGLADVDNTSDLDKPVSTATQAALDDLGDDLGAVEATTEEIANTFRSDILRIYLNLAELRLNQVGTPHGVADSFDDQDGVDLSASVGEVYDAAGKRYHGVRSGYEASESLPAMTSANAPSGHLVSANFDSGGSQVPWKAADDSTGTHWSTPTPGTSFPILWTREGPAPITVGAYRIHLDGSSNASWPTAWTLRGSNDGSSWTTLHTVSGETWSGMVGDSKVFVASVAAAFARHQLQITALVSGVQLIIREIELLQALPADDMDLRSIQFAAYATPVKASLLVAASSSGVITPGTNLVGSVSRDDGDTWTEADLVARETVGSFTFFEALAFDISAQPTGDEMRWRVETLADIDVGAVVVSWS